MGRLMNYSSLDTHTTASQVQTRRLAKSLPALLPVLPTNQATSFLLILLTWFLGFLRKLPFKYKHFCFTYF